MNVRCLSISLALAVQLMAGPDGIREQMDPRELGYGPLDQNIFAWSDEQRHAIKPLPTSLYEALRALENDYDFLLRGEVFDEGQITEWIKAKTDDYFDVQNRPHPYRIALEKLRHSRRFWGDRHCERSEAVSWQVRRLLRPANSAGLARTFGCGGRPRYEIALYFDA